MSIKVTNVKVNKLAVIHQKLRN